MTSDPYTLHRATLGPVLRNDSLQPAFELRGPQELASFLIKEGLHGLWFERLRLEACDGRGEELRAIIGKTLKVQLARDLAAGQLMKETNRLLCEHDIPYFIAKGGQLKRTIYGQTWHRAAVDIDLFVREVDRDRAVQLMTDSGCRASPLKATLSHELKLTRYTADIDLHWHLLRPGRARPGLMGWLFDRRERFGDYSGLDATACVLVMLIHPPITKYLISPASKLIHMVDLARLAERAEVDWEALEVALNRFGVKTAAWSSAYLLRSLTSIDLPNGLEARIRPRPSHAAYLKRWIDRGWISRGFQRRWLVAGFFNLALQDKFEDMVRALYMKTRLQFEDPPFLASDA
jgi:hypothetical protein